MLTVLATRGLLQSPCPLSTTEEMAFGVNFLILLDVTKCLWNLLRRFSLLDVRPPPHQGDSRSMGRLGFFRSATLIEFFLYVKDFVGNFMFSTISI